MLPSTVHRQALFLFALLAQLVGTGLQLCLSPPAHKRVRQIVPTKVMWHSGVFSNFATFATPSTTCHTFHYFATPSTAPDCVLLLLLLYSSLLLYCTVVVLFLAVLCFHLYSGIRRRTSRSV